MIECALPGFIRAVIFYLLLIRKIERNGDAFFLT